MIEWRDSMQAYSTGGKDAFLGKWRVASIGWDGVRRTDEKWVVYFHLPGLKSKRIQYEYRNRRIYRKSQVTFEEI